LRIHELSLTFVNSCLIPALQMTTIHLITQIKAPKQVVFDLSRNITIHEDSVHQTNEKAIAGRTSGLIEFNETVTWRGKHFGFYLTHKSRMTAMDLYDYFVDEMEEGSFASFKHQHFFAEENGVTVMTDLIQYETPFGIFGMLFDRIILKNHMTNLIAKRNALLKELAEKS
jgi:ligand-binding SRPBCC domain-containing protein